MASYTTSQEAMQQGAVKVEQASNDIQGLLGTLQNEVDTMMGGWGGEAATAFVQVHEAFGQQANKINTALRNMHEALISTHRTYGTQETDQSSSFQQMIGTING